MAKTNCIKIRRLGLANMTPCIPRAVLTPSSAQASLCFSVSFTQTLFSHDWPKLVINSGGIKGVFSKCLQHAQASTRASHRGSRPPFTVAQEGETTVTTINVEMEGQKGHVPCHSSHHKLTVHGE